METKEAQEKSLSNRWCFTLNNYHQYPPLPPFIPEVMDYMIYCHEVGEKTGTPHLQGYIRFKNRQTAKSILRLVNSHLSLRLCLGNEKQNRDYCIKQREKYPEYPFLEEGQYVAWKGTKGHRSDLDTVAMKLQLGATLKDIADEMPTTFIKNHAGIEKWIALHPRDPPLERQVQVTYLWGPTATGKTHRVITTYSGNLFQVEWPGPMARGGFDDYKEEDVILFDEFNDNQWTIVQMNKFLDKWPCPLPCRYRNKKAFWTKVFICSNVDPEFLYFNEQPLIRAAFKRRLTNIIYVNNQHDVLPFQIRDAKPINKETEIECSTIPNICSPTVCRISRPGSPDITISISSTPCRSPSPQRLKRTHEMK